MSLCLSLFLSPFVLLLSLSLSLSSFPSRSSVRNAEGNFVVVNDVRGKNRARASITGDKRECGGIIVSLGGAVLLRMQPLTREIADSIRSHVSTGSMVIELIPEPFLAYVTRGSLAVSPNRRYYNRCSIFSRVLRFISVRTRLFADWSIDRSIGRFFLSIHVPLCANSSSNTDRWIQWGEHTEKKPLAFCGYNYMEK